VVRVGAQEDPDGAAAGDGQHPDGGVVQLLLGAAEQLLAGQGRDHLEHLLAGVGGQGEAGAVDRPADVPLDDRDVEHVLVERGDGEHAEEPVLADQPSVGVDDADRQVVGLHGAQHAALGAGAGEHEQLGRGGGPSGSQRGADPVVADEHAEPRPVGPEPAADDGVVAVAEEREVLVGEPAQQVRDVVGARDPVRGAVGVEQAVGEQLVGQCAGLAGHRRGVADDLLDVVQHLRDVRGQPGGGGAAQVDVDPGLGDRLGGRIGRVGIGQHRLQVAVRCPFDDDDGVDDAPHLASGSADGGEHRLDQVGHVVGDDLEHRRTRPRAVGADADQLVAGVAAPGELAMSPGSGAQDRTGVAGPHVRGVPAVERVETGVDRVGGSRGLSGVGVVLRLRGDGLLTGPTDHVRAPRGSGWCWRRPAWRDPG